MRSRISWLVLATTSAIVMAFVIPLCLLVRTLATDRAMSAADQAARNAALVITSVPNNAQLDGYLVDLNGSIAPQVSVLTPSGRSLGTADDLRQDPDVRRALTGEGLRVTGEDGGAVLLPVTGENGTAVVRASVTEDDLRRGVMPAWLGIIALGLVLIGLGWVIARQLGRRISEPLRGVAQTAHQLREGDLSARATVGGTPETVELARALNGLAERTGELLAAERAAVGDLSHRLRTPVTALRLDAEAVGDPAVSRRLQDHITVLQLTVDQIVKEARRPVESTLSARCDAAATIAMRVAFWSVLAEDDGRALDRRRGPPAAAGPGVGERPGRPARRPHRQRVRPHPGRDGFSVILRPGESQLRADRVRRRGAAGRPSRSRAQGTPGSASTSLGVPPRTAAAGSSPGPHPRVGPRSRWRSRWSSDRSVVATAAFVLVVPAARSRRGRRLGRVKARCVGVRRVHRRGRSRGDRRGGDHGSWQRHRVGHVGDAGAADADGRLHARRPPHDRSGPYDLGRRVVRGSHVRRRQGRARVGRRGVGTQATGEPGDEGEGTEQDGEELHAPTVTPRGLTAPRARVKPASSPRRCSMT